MLGELLLRYLGAVVLLERDEKAGLAGLTAREVALILRRIELSIGLQFGGGGDPARRSEARVVAQLRVADGDSTPAVLLLKQDLLNHLVERLVLEALLLVL